MVIKKRIITIKISIITIKIIINKTKIIRIQITNKMFILYKLLTIIIQMRTIKKNKNHKTLQETPLLLLNLILILILIC